MRRHLLLVAALFPLTGLPSDGHVQASALAQGIARSSPEFDHTHSAYAKLLIAHVQDGLVHYEALKSNRKPLDDYLAQLEVVSRDEFDGWNKPQRMAFLINAYNAYTLQLIIDHYPVKSIKDIGSWIRGPWKQPVVHLWGGSSTLDDIEHGMLRKTYADPRVHFALVCASRSCPVLRTEAYRPADLDLQLDAAGREFLADRTRNTFNRTEHLVNISSIFKWFRSDFGANESELLTFLSRFAPQDSGEGLTKSAWTVSYLPYDWSLNDRAVTTP